VLALHDRYGNACDSLPEGTLLSRICPTTCELECSAVMTQCAEQLPCSDDPTGELSISLFGDHGPRTFLGSTAVDESRVDVCRSVVVHDYFCNFKVGVIFGVLGLELLPSYPADSQLSEVCPVTCGACPPAQLCPSCPDDADGVLDAVGTNCTQALSMLGSCSFDLHESNPVYPLLGESPWNFTVLQCEHHEHLPCVPDIMTAGQANESVRRINASHYIFGYTPPVVGYLQLSLMLDGEHQKGDYLSSTAGSVSGRFADDMSPVVVLAQDQTQALASVSTASGSGLDVMTSGESVTIYIQANKLEDGVVTPRQHLGDTVGVEVDGISLKAPAVSQYLHNGSYLIEFTPEARDATVPRWDLNIHVLLNGDDVADSPFAVAVVPGPVDVLTSTVIGSGLIGTLAGISDTITLVLRDRLWNLRFEEDDITAVFFRQENVGAAGEWIYDDASDLVETLLFHNGAPWNSTVASNCPETCNVCENHCNVAAGCVNDPHDVLASIGTSCVWAGALGCGEQFHTYVPLIPPGVRVAELCPAMCGGCCVDVETGEAWNWLAGNVSLELGHNVSSCADLEASCANANVLGSCPLTCAACPPDTPSVAPPGQTTTQGDLFLSVDASWATATGTTTTQTLQQGEDTSLGFPSVFWAVYALPGDTILFSTQLLGGAGSLSDSYIEVYASDYTSQIDRIAYNDDGGPGLASYLVWECQFAGLYYFTVRAFATSYQFGQFAATLQLLNPELNPRADCLSDCVDDPQDLVSFLSDDVLYGWGSCEEIADELGCGDDADLHSLTHVKTEDELVATNETHLYRSYGSIYFTNQTYELRYHLKTAGVYMPVIVVRAHHRVHRFIQNVVSVFANLVTVVRFVG
jgi:hypothetical protein